MLGCDDEVRKALPLEVSDTLAASPQSLLSDAALKEWQERAAAIGLPFSFSSQTGDRVSLACLEAARAAEKVLAGSVYERYFDLHAAFQQVADVSFDPFAFGVLCELRAGFTTRSSQNMQKRKDCIVEQLQVMTSNNLAALVVSLGLVESIDVNWDDLVLSTWQWVLAKLEDPPEEEDARGLVCREVATAWRQLIFYLALASSQKTAISKMGFHLHEVSGKFGDAMHCHLHAFLIAPLQKALDGETVGKEYALLGNVPGSRHWLLDLEWGRSDKEEEAALNVFHYDKLNEDLDADG